MKKLILILVIMVTLMAVGCNNGENGKPVKELVENEKITGEKVKEEIIDLTGNWVQEGKEFEDSYQAGYISGERIEIFWITEGGESHALYWSGTYNAPQEGITEYTWDSHNNKTQTELALLASDDDQKSFTYKDGKIMYDISVMGVDATLNLVPTETDYMNFDTVTKSIDMSNLQEVELINSSYAVSEDNGWIKIYYMVDISNPNEEYAIRFPEILITARNANGKILKTDEMVLNGIAAGDTYKYGNYVSYEGEAPEIVEISVGNSKNDYLTQSSSDIIQSRELSVTNVNGNAGTLFSTLTGEVTNNSTEDLDNVALIALFASSDYEIVGVDTTYVDDLRAGDTKPFEIPIQSDLEDYEYHMVIALQW